MENAFQSARGVIDERFFDCRPRNLIADFDAHLVIADGQRFVSSIGQSHDQGTERFIVRGSLKTSQPLWCLCDIGQFFVPIHAHQQFLIRLHDPFGSPRTQQGKSPSLFERIQFGRNGLDCTGMQSYFHRRNGFEQCARTEGQFHFGRQCDFDRVGAPQLGANPVTGAK